MKTKQTWCSVSLFNAENWKQQLFKVVILGIGWNQHTLSLRWTFMQGERSWTIGTHGGSCLSISESADIQFATYKTEVFTCSLGAKPSFS